jgi:hypothetical protein
MMTDGDNADGKVQKKNAPARLESLSIQPPQPQGANYGNGINSNGNNSNDGGRFNQGGQYSASTGSTVTSSVSSTAAALPSAAAAEIEGIRRLIYVT